MRVADVIVGVKAKRAAISGGEPLIVDGWRDAAKRLRDAGIYVTLYTSGWVMDERVAEDLAGSVTKVIVSLDGATEATHDAIRQRSGSHRRAREALGALARVKNDRVASGRETYSLGVDYTVVRSNFNEMDAFVPDITKSFPGLDYVRFAMAVPEGPAADEDFAERELLTNEEMLALPASEARLAALARHGVQVSVTDMRYYVPYSPYGTVGATIAHLEPDGQLRAFGVYEAKVGSVLEEPFEVLWRRALAWRNDPFVMEQIKSIETPHDWARVARVLDRRYGSDPDKARIALRLAKGR
jgi:MoaA/NifB/PqqE/SkfB family radical SAM enzyme